MIILLVVVSIFYLYEFFERKNYQISITTTSLQTYPFYDLSTNKFFLSFKFRFDGIQVLAETMEEQYVRLRANHVTIENKKEISTVEITRETLSFKSCDSLGSYSDEINFEESDLDAQGMCLEFDSETKIGGTDSNDLFKYIEVRFEVCDKTNSSCSPGTIAATNTVESPGSSRLDTFFAGALKLQVDISFLDASGNMQNYDEPFNLNSNSNNQLRLNLYQEKIYDFYFGALQVETNDGWFTAKSETRTALQLTHKFFDSIYRSPLYESDFETSAGTTIMARPYATLRFLASNQVTTIKRDYQTLIDTFSKIGGASQAITFIFIIIMIYHQQVKLDQELLNEAILQNDHNYNTPSNKRNPIPNEKEKNEKGGRIYYYSYKDVFCFKFCCCKKKSKKYKVYNQHMKAIHQRMDIRNIIINSGNINVLSNVLLEPYQMKLISYLKKEEDENTQDVKRLSVQKAVKLLQENIKNDHKNEIHQKIDEFLIKHLDDEFKEKQVIWTIPNEESSLNMPKHKKKSIIHTHVRK